MSLRSGDQAVSQGGASMKTLRIFAAILALAATAAAEEHKGRKPEECFKQGQDLYAKGQYEAAIREFEHVAFGSDKAEPWYHRGLCQYQLKKDREAVSDFSRCIALDAGVAEYRLMRGYANFRLERWVCCTEDLDEAVRLKPALLDQCRETLEAARKHPLPRLEVGESRLLSGHYDQVTWLRFTSDSRGLRSKSQSPEIRDWTLDGRCSRAWKGLFHDWSPDGSLLVSGTQLLAEKDGSEVRKLDQAWSRWTSDVSESSFRPDGLCVAGGCADGMVRCWNVATGKQIWEVQGHHEKVTNVAWSPDGRTVATAELNGHRVRLWNGTDGTRGAVLALADSVSGIGFHPDNRRLIVTMFRQIVIWDVVSDKRASFAPAEKIHSAAADPSGRWIAVGTGSGQVVLWDVEAGGSLKTLDGHWGDAVEVAWSPDGKWLASAGSDQQIRLWSVDGIMKAEAPTGRWDSEWEAWNAFPEGAWVKGKTTEYDEYSEEGYEVVVILTLVKKAPDMLTLREGDGPATRTISRLDPGRLCSTCQKPDSSHWTLSKEAPEKVKIGSRELAGVRVTMTWESCQGKGPSEPREFGVYSREVPGWAVDRGNYWKVLEFGRSADDSTDVPTAEALIEQALALFKKGDFKGAAQKFGEALKKDPANAGTWYDRGNCNYRLKEYVKALADFEETTVLEPASASGWQGRAFCNYALARWSEAVRCYEEFVRLSPESAEASKEALSYARTQAASGEQVFLTTHTDSISGLAFSPDGRTVATGGKDSTILIRDAGSGELLKTIAGGHSVVTCLAWLPDGKLLATGDQFGIVHFWDVSRGTETAVLDDYVVSTEGLAISADGKRIAVLAGRFGIYDVETRKSVRSSSEYVDAIALSADGKFVVTGNREGKVGVFPADGSREKLWDGHTGRVKCVAFGSGAWMASGGEDKTVRIWDRENEKVRALPGHNAAIRSTLFSPDGKWLASVDAGEVARFWEVESGVHRLALAGVRSPVAWSPDGRRFAWIDSARAIRIRPVGDSLEGKGPK